MKTKTMIIVLIAIVVIGAIYFLLSKKSEVNIEQEEITTTTTSVPTVINCEADSNCLSTNFLSCNPLDFKMEFIEPGSQFIISVVGKEEDKCHYLTEVINPDGLIQMGYECKVPLTEVSLDTVKHFFGQNSPLIF